MGVLATMEVKEARGIEMRGMLPNKFIEAAHCAILVKVLVLDDITIEICDFKENIDSDAMNPF